MRKVKKRRGLRRMLLAILAVILLVVLVIALQTPLTERVYRLASPKIEESLRIVLLSDLHSCDYGAGGQALLEAVQKAAPDVILMAGDMLDDEMPHEMGLAILRALGEAYPCYYVSGNHEYLTQEIGTLKAWIRDCGITVLEGESVAFTKAGQTISLSGVDDPILQGGAATLAQLAKARAAAEDLADYRLLLSHRPELIDDYRAAGFDLVLSGHAHGGQWRIPGLLNGLLAPHQGLFPRWAGGYYDLADCDFIVSRGLSRESTKIPRLFNPPELVVIELAGV